MRANFITKRLKAILPKIGGQLFVEPHYQYSGCIVFDNGVRTFYKRCIFDINPAGAVKIGIDKGYANYFLKEFGFRVPDFDTFANAAINKLLNPKKGMEEGYNFATTLGFPIIIKPNDGTQGKHVYKVRNKAEYFNYAQQLFTDAEVMLVQQFVTGNDYRIVVLDDKVYCAYQRVPLQLVGNGKDTIARLFEAKTKEWKQQKISKKIKLNDKRLQAQLHDLQLRNDHILEKDRVISLLNIANLSLGGTIVDYTDTISEAYQALAIDITKKMGLRFCGIDIMTNSIDGAADDYWVIEINSAPGLFSFPGLGEAQSRIIDELYIDMLQIIKYQKLQQY